METVHPNQFFGLPPCCLEEADAVIVPLPLEKTVSYGAGTCRAPRAVLEASCQLELFDEETLVDFAQSPRIHTLPPMVNGPTVEDYLRAVQDLVAPLREKFVVGLGGEHTITFGMVTGLTDRPADVTVVQIDAHADMIDKLDGRHWSHGTVMKRLWDKGYRLMQIGVRSLSRSEYDLCVAGERVKTYFAHQLPEKWAEILNTLRGLQGTVYLTVDVDGLDPSVVPSTGTPQPGGLTWNQTVEIIRTLTAAPQCRLVGADVVEFVASPLPPGCDLIVAKLLAKLLAFWQVNGSAADE